MDLLNTRWMFFTPELQGTFYNGTHVEVVSLHGDLATIVTCYSIPLRAWDVPISSITMRPGAFSPLGHARDFAWVDREVHVHTTRAWEQANLGSEGAEWAGTWAIASMSSHEVRFYPRAPVGEGAPIDDHFSPWTDFLNEFRRATERERQAFELEQALYFGRDDDLEEEPEAEGPPSPEPESVPEGPVASLWDHLNEDRDTV